MEKGIARRDLLKMGMAATAFMAAEKIFPAVAHAAVPTISLEKCLSMGPVDMASASGLVSASWEYLLQAADEIRNPDLRSKVKGILKDPAPTLAAKVDKEAVSARLKEAGLLDAGAKELLPAYSSPSKTLQPFLSAPGSGYTSHHSYPGGLVTHTCLNVQVSQALFKSYRDVFDFSLDRDVVVASQILHDLHKPWVFQWQKDASSRTEQPLAGTGQHHVLSIAESIVRGIPSDVVVAQACAHDHPGGAASEASVVNWIKAASILAGVDPVQTGLLAEGGKTLPLPRRMEGFVTHLGDHDFVLSVPVVGWLLPVMKKVAVSRYGISEKDLDGKPFNSLRNYVFSQATAMNLYSCYVKEGDSGVERVMKSLVASR